MEKLHNSELPESEQAAGIPPAPRPKFLRSTEKWLAFAANTGFDSHPVELGETGIVEPADNEVVVD